MSKTCSLVVVALAAAALAFVGPLRAQPAPNGPVLPSGGVVEGAGFQPAPYPISANAIVSVFGIFPGVTEQLASGFPLRTMLNGVAVTFDGMPAPLLYVSARQINLVAPTLLSGLTTVQVAVSIGASKSDPVTVNVAPAGPGIFFDAATGAGAILHGADLSPVAPANPTRPGETLVLFLTGMGDTNPPPVDGQAAPRNQFSQTVLNPTVLVNNAPASVRFSGLAPDFSGLYQINFDVPDSAPSGNDTSVNVFAGGHLSNTVRLAVQ